MSRFNTTSPGTKTSNMAGGEAYAQSPELELISILFTSFAKDEYYRKASDSINRLKELIRICDKKFVAQAAVYARTQFGMRSITHVVASELAKHVSGETWAKNFYTAIVHRPDDMLEIMAYHLSANGKETNPMRKGFAKSFDKFDRYALAKYRGEGKAVKLIDIVNLVHPTPTENNREALSALMKGDLKSFDTWESELTRAGQNASNEDEKSEFKKEVWVKLISEKKIGYFALLRNLRNILEQAPEILPAACEMLVDEKLIRKSLVLPFRYVTALEQFEKIPNATKIVMALNKAVDIACANVPKFDGKSLVVCDYSGSMGEGYNSFKYKGTLFGAIFAKANEADFMIFGERAEYIGFNPMDSTLTITKHFAAQNTNNGRIQVGHATNFHSIFVAAKGKYDRIVIFSDMQGWVGYHTPTKDLEAYKKRTGANPYIHSFDLAGNGSMQFPENNVCALAGFSEKIFDVMQMVEIDKKVLIKKIKEFQF